jgi:DNA-binding NtrC family response regulator
LLGALERRRFCRVGGHKPIDVDVRIVAATNRDLREDVNHGRFRLDLYYRLAVVTLEVPPLRQRAKDVPLLVEHFAREAGQMGSLSDVISEATMASLVRYRWPGNVRELRNYVQALVAMGEANLPANESPPASELVVQDGLEALLDRPFVEARSAVVSEFEQRYLALLLRRSRGNVAQAARDAHMARSHLNELLRRHGLREEGRDEP